MASYLNRLAGGLFKNVPAATVGGVASAGQIAQLGAAGTYDPSFFPATIGQDITPLPASEALSAGNQVNIWNNAGTISVRKADAASGKRGDGFVQAAVVSAATAQVYRGAGPNTGVSGLTPGVDYYLGASGAVTPTQNTTSGQLDQFLGTATAAGVLDQVSPQPPVLNG